MKLAFVGKGGSGKTTVCALAALSAAASGKAVVAYDADVNQHLGFALGAATDKVAKMNLLGHDQLPIKRYLRGSNPLVASDEHMFKTTPPGRGSRLLKVSGGNVLYRRYALPLGYIKLLRVGPMEESDVGAKCFHGKSGIVELMVGHTVDRRDELVLVDATAGTDSLASGLLAKMHALVVVVEPALHSTAVYRQIADLAVEYGTPLLLVANKTESPADVDFITAQTGVAPAAILPRSLAVRRLERGEPVAWQRFEPELRQAVAKLHQIAGEMPMDEAAYQERAYRLHRHNAQAWINAQYNIQAEAQIDETFLFPSVAK